MSANNFDLDLEIKRIFPRKSRMGGVWITGTINAEYRFSALVFRAHAECAEYELGRSRISKLWVQRIATRATVFNFDRGLDIAVTNRQAQAIVDFLCEGLADCVFASA
ncbi:MAG: hypothetical protein SFX18_00560 [Pirellulales bacterium]|nr:hypothetical protein [Pirellulales bacterium]